MPVKTATLGDIFSLIDKSLFISFHEVTIELKAINGAYCGRFVMTLINPPMASEPYKEEAGPFTISTLSIMEFGIPLSP